MAKKRVVRTRRVERPVKKSGSGFMLGLVFGMAVGATLALLYAPQAGEETRAQLVEQSEEWRQASQGGVGGVTQQVRARYGDAFAQGLDAYQKAKEEVLTRYNKARNG